MRKPRQILLCVFVFIKNTSNYKIKVKQMIFYARFPDYSSSLRNSVRNLSVFTKGLRKKIKDHNYLQFRLLITNKCSKKLFQLRLITLLQNNESCEFFLVNDHDLG